MPQLPPDQVAKPGGGRGIKKKKVVKKGSTDLAAEREMRGLRVPKKRRALPGKEQRKTEITTPKASKRVVRITEGVTVGDLGRSMGVKAGDLIKKLMELGQMATLNQVLDVDTATLLAGEFGYSVENVSFDAESAIEEAPEEAVVGESVTAPAGRHRDGPRRSRQDLAARRDSPHQRDGARVRRNHPAHRRLHRRGQWTDDRVCRYSRP